MASNWTAEAALATSRCVRAMAEVPRPLKDAYMAGAAARKDLKVGRRPRRTLQEALPEDAGLQETVVSVQGMDMGNVVVRQAASSRCSAFGTSYGEDARQL